MLLCAAIINNQGASCLAKAGPACPALRSLLLCAASTMVTVASIPPGRSISPSIMLAC
jgi:hypothetical protein